MNRFSDLVGCETVKRRMQEALRSGKISHAYILSAEAGAGKHMLAERFAQALQCESPVLDAEGYPEPCGKCASCLQCETRNHPDILYVNRGEKRTLGVEPIRTMRADVAIKPYASKFKIYIIEDAETMTPQAQNALLKTLEEPPAYAVILLLASGTGAFLSTITSRSVILRIPEVPSETIAKYLQEKKGLDAGTARTAAGFAGGRVGKALLLTEADGAAEQREEILSFLLSLKDKDAFAVSVFAEELGADTELFEGYLNLFLHDLLLAKTLGDEDKLTFSDAGRSLLRMSETVHYEQLQKMLDAVNEYRTMKRANAGGENSLMLLLLTIRDELRQGETA